MVYISDFHANFLWWWYLFVHKLEILTILKSNIGGDTKLLMFLILKLVLFAQNSSFYPY